MDVEEVVEKLELHCPSCKQAIVDVVFTPSNDGGAVSIEHARPYCEWWGTKSAMAWAADVVRDVITSSMQPTAEA